MSLHHLEADLVARISTVRTRLRSHRSHRLKVCVYTWWSAILDKSRTLALIRHSLADQVGDDRYRSFDVPQRERSEFARRCSTDGLP